jgi:hypothetical protein
MARFQDVVVIFMILAFVLAPILITRQCQSDCERKSCPSGSVPKLTPRSFECWCVVEAH